MTLKRKLPARYATIVMPLLLSLMMTSVVSLISTARSIGFTSALLQLWLGNWALSWVVAFPVMLLVLPVVRRLTSMLVEKPA